MKKEKEDNFFNQLEWEMEKGYMFSMIGNLSPESKPFKVGDRVYFKASPPFGRINKETLIIEEIKYGKGGYSYYFCCKG